MFHGVLARLKEHGQQHQGDANEQHRVMVHLGSFAVLPRGVRFLLGAMGLLLLRAMGLLLL